MLCVRCGAELKLGSAFCEECGVRRVRRFNSFVRRSPVTAVMATCLLVALNFGVVYSVLYIVFFIKYMLLAVGGINVDGIIRIGERIIFICAVCCGDFWVYRYMVRSFWVRD